MVQLIEMPHGAMVERSFEHVEHDECWLPPVKEDAIITEREMTSRKAAIALMDEIPVFGTTVIRNEVVEAIAAMAVQEVEGVAEVGAWSIRRVLSERLGGAQKQGRGVKAEVGRKEAIVDVAVRVGYGFSIPKTVIELRCNVANRLLDLCGLVAKEVNVRVFGLGFPKKAPSRVE